MEKEVATSNIKGEKLKDFEEEELEGEVKKEI